MHTDCPRPPVRRRGWILGQRVRVGLVAALSSLPPAAFAQEAQATLETVTLSAGRGQVRSVQQVGRGEFEAAPSGQSPLATVARLPGASFQAADALGLYEWSVRFSLRGFAQGQLGFTLDGIPLGDMSYGSLNGLHISRALASEDLVRAELSQGSGALDTPSSSNLGGTLQFFSAEAAERSGVRAALTLGSDRHQRLHLRADSGETPLGALFISATRQRTDKWKGEGQQRQDQLTLKWARRFGEHRLSVLASHSDRQELDYQDLSLAQLARLGWNWDNFFPNFDAALNASRTLCGHGALPYQSRCDDAYYAGAGLRKDRLLGLNLSLRQGEDWQWQSTAYLHRNAGRGLWYTPYEVSPDGTPLALRTTEYGLRRHGLSSRFTLQLGAHQLRASIWLEDNDFDQARRFYATPPSAVPTPYRFPREPFRTAWDYRFTTRSRLLSLADTVNLRPDLQLHLGFKSLHVQSQAQRRSGSGPEGSIRAGHDFLPQLGLVLDRPSGEWFASVSRNLRAFQAAATGTSPFATTQAGFDAIKVGLRPEQATQVEAGWRGSAAHWQAAVSLYSTQFRDRLLSVTQGAAIQGNPSALSNVGRVRSQGLEGAISMRLRPGWNADASLSLNHSIYRDDVPGRDGQAAVPTAGKAVVDAPRRLLKLQLRHDDGRRFAQLSVDAQSRRFYSYTNDASVPGRLLVHGSAGLHLGSFGAWQKAQLRLGVHNLTGKRHIATLGSNDFVNSDPTGQAQTLLPGAPRQLTLGLSARL